jgi:hypothetical protein
MKPGDGVLSTQSLPYKCDDCTDPEPTATPVPVGGTINGITVIGTVTANPAGQSYYGSVQGGAYIVAGTSLTGGGGSYEYLTKPSGCRKDIYLATAGIGAAALAILLPAGFSLVEASSVVAILTAVGPAGWILLGVGLFMTLLAAADAYNECHGN